MAMSMTAELRVEIALLSGRTACLGTSLDSSVQQLMLEAGRELRVAIGTLCRQDGSQLDEMSSILDAQLSNGEVLSATVAPFVRVELEEKVLEQLEQLMHLEGKVNLEPETFPEVKSPEEMAHLFHLILSKALSAPDCAFACVELMLCFLDRYPTLSDGSQDNGIGREEPCQPIRCKRLLLDVVQATYEKVFSQLDKLEAQKKIWWSGWIQVFGHLLMQRLITVRVAEVIFEEMIGVQDEALPLEPNVHCACDLLELCGQFLENSAGDLMRVVFDRLVQLYDGKLPASAAAKRVAKPGTMAMYPPRTLKRLEGVFLLRGQGWQPKA